jgi:hypothetical protein
MYKGVMTNRNIVANNGFGAFIRAVNDGAILYIYFISYAYAVYIAPHHGIEPDAAIIAHYNIPYNSGIGRNKAVTSECGINPFNV